MEFIDNVFLTRVSEEPVRGGVLRDTILTSKKQLVRDVRVGDE